MKNIEIPFIKDMFDAIAPRYDLLNRLLSLRQDVRWRRKMAAKLRSLESPIILDMACGTGDVALEIRRRKADALIVGADFSPNMLKLAKSKIDSSAAKPLIALFAADAFNLPFKPASFDAVTIAFGIRNITDKDTVLKRFRESLKPGGILLILELATPKKGLFLALFSFYFHRVLPLIGAAVSRNSKAYTYLPASVTTFPPADQFARMISNAGFRDVTFEKLTFGIATLFVGRNP